MEFVIIRWEGKGGGGGGGGVFLLSSSEIRRGLNFVKKLLKLLFGKLLNGGIINRREVEQVINYTFD